MRIEYTKAAVKTIMKLDKPEKQRIREAIEGLAETPQRGDIKPMEGKPEGRYRLRVGSYRVIFRYDNDGAMVVICVLDIGPRGDIYK